MPEYIRTDEPLTDEDPSLAWLRAEHPEVLEARETPHEFVHMERDPRVDRCPPEGNPCCVCERCWERKSFRAHPRRRR